MASTSSPANATIPSITHIYLLCLQREYITAFEHARRLHDLPSTITITTHSSSLAAFPADVTLDAIVSPANSYGRLDGGFDDAISRACSPRSDYLALTRVAQTVLYDRWRGFAPPGTCSLVRIPSTPAFQPPQTRNIWGIKHIALCPTMRLPSDVRWDREVVYEAVWSLLCAVDNHNREAERGEQIRSVLMTPLATGTGYVSAERWAAQLVLALKHYLDALERPERWGALEFGDVLGDTEALRRTWEEELR